MWLIFCPQLSVPSCFVDCVNMYPELWWCFWCAVSPPQHSGVYESDQWQCQHQKQHWQRQHPAGGKWWCWTCLQHHQQRQWWQDQPYHLQERRSVLCASCHCQVLDSKVLDSQVLDCWTVRYWTVRYWTLRYWTLSIGLSGNGLSGIGLSGIGLSGIENTNGVWPVDHAAVEVFPLIYFGIKGKKC